MVFNHPHDLNIEGVSMIATISEGDGYKIIDNDNGHNIHIKLDEKTDKIGLDWISDILTLHEIEITEYKDSL